MDIEVSSSIAVIYSWEAQGGEHNVQTGTPRLGCGDTCILGLLLLIEFGGQPGVSIDQLINKLIKHFLHTHQPLKRGTLQR